MRPIGQQVPAHTYLSQREPEEEEVTNKKNELPPFIPERRLIHFDLKGAPPRIGMYKQVCLCLKKEVKVLFMGGILLGEFTK